MSIDTLNLLKETLRHIPNRTIACSGGIDSLLLAVVSHRESSTTTRVTHAVSPAVPAEATERVKSWAQKEGWDLAIVEAGEFEDEDYLRNPVNRCYYCKSNLYNSLDAIGSSGSSVVLSGANLDDLGEYRPGLEAAAENGVRHPYVEAQISKQDIRKIARMLELPFAELAASPCLSSRLYTGTRVTSSKLRAIELAEQYIKNTTDITVVRCRVKEDNVLIEVPQTDRVLVTEKLVAQISTIMRQVEPGLNDFKLDAKPYQAGRAFLTRPADIINASEIHE